MGLRFVGLLPCAQIWVPKAKTPSLVRRIRPTTSPYTVPTVQLQPNTNTTNVLTDSTNCRCSSNTATLPTAAQPIAAIAPVAVATQVPGTLFQNH